MNILIVADEPRPDRAGDAASLHRLAVILLDNAIKYAGTGGAVTLRLAAAGSPGGFDGAQHRHAHPTGPAAPYF